MIGRILTGRGLNVVLRLFLGVMFVYAAWGKVLNPQEFAISVRAYKIVPISLSNLFALAVSWSELAAGVMLIVGLCARKAAGTALILLAMFATAIAAVMVRGMVVDCGCFGSDGSDTGGLLLVRNLLLMVAAFIVLRFNDGFLGIDAATRLKPKPAR
jgi:uncharacterized membrane protein YphA (DoxX/SURF4 family)